MSTVLYIVRHGEATGNIDRIFHGQTDSTLTDNGHKQAQAVAKRLSGKNIDAVYASDLTRAKQTAQYIADAHQLTVQIEPLLREVNGGDWEEMPFEQIGIDFSEFFDLFQNKPLLACLPNGEKMIDFQQRGLTALRKIIHHHPDQTVVVVTHGTMIRVLMCEFLKVKEEDMKDLVWHDNTSVTKVIGSEEGFELIYQGDNSHLGELSTLAKQDWWKK